jgi:hypothetical protein
MKKHLMESFVGTEHVPTDADMDSAKTQWLEENNANESQWLMLTKRKRNMLAKDAMFSREYQSLARAIMRK